LETYRTNMSWGALPFALTAAGTVNTNRFTRFEQWNPECLSSGKSGESLYLRQLSGARRQHGNAMIL